MKFVLLLPLVSTAAISQTYVNGSVVDSVTGAPVSNAYIASAEASEPMPLTDATGRFRVQEHNKWAYVRAVHNGYLDSAQNYPVEPGPAAEIRVMLVPQAVISGRVLDENGLPVRGARVSALGYRLVNGQRQLRPWLTASSETNELGEYRIFGLAAGRYYLGFEPGKLADWDPRYSARLYPDAAEAESAQPIEARAGEENGGHDFCLSRHEGVTITGHIVRPEESQNSGARVGLVFASTGHTDYLVPVKQTGDAFTIAHVPPGNYTLRTWRGTLQPRIGDLMGDRTIQVGSADISDVNLEVRPIAEQDIAGTIVFEGHTKTGPMAVSLRRMLGDVKSALSDADGSFVVKGILPGEYMLGVRNAPGDGVPQTDGSAVAEQLGGRDVTAQIFDIGNDAAGTLKISVAAVVAKVDGKLVDAAGQPLGGRGIVFLSSVDNAWSSAQARDDGTFTTSFRKAGEYRVYLAPVAQVYQMMRDADFLDAHHDDFPAVRIAEGANAPLVLRAGAR